jgi:polysaccharide biosynthesis protein VpsQ
LKKFLPLAFLVFMALVIFWANTNTMPIPLRRLYGGVPHSDKIGHFVIYGTLAYLLTWAMPFRRVTLGRFSLPLGVVIAIAIASLEEFSQIFILRRNADIFDLLASYLGIYASTWIPCLSVGQIDNLSHTKKDSP